MKASQQGTAGAKQPTRENRLRGPQDSVGTRQEHPHPQKGRLGQKRCASEAGGEGCNEAICASPSS